MRFFAKRHGSLQHASSADQHSSLATSALRLAATARAFAATRSVAELARRTSIDDEDMLTALEGRTRHRLFVRRLKRRGGNGGAPARLISPLQLAASFAR